MPCIHSKPLPHTALKAELREPGGLARRKEAGPACPAPHSPDRNRAASTQFKCLLNRQMTEGLLAQV